MADVAWCKTFSKNKLITYQPLFRYVRTWYAVYTPIFAHPFLLFYCNVNLIISEIFFWPI
jgi:hypothetical protein